jgi:hypothetical protein
MELNQEEWQRGQKREEAGYKERMKLLNQIKPLVFLRATRENQLTLLENVVQNSSPESFALMKDFGITSRQGLKLSESNTRLFQKMTNFPQLLILSLTIPSKYFNMPLFQRALRADMANVDTVSTIKTENFYSCYRDLQRFIYIDTINKEYNLLCEDLSRAELQNNKKKDNEVFVNLLYPLMRSLIPASDNKPSERNQTLQRLTFLQYAQAATQNLRDWITNSTDGAKFQIKKDPTIDEITGTTSLGRTVKRILFKIKVARQLLNAFEIVDVQTSENATV